MRRTFLWINFVLASLIVLLIFLQAYFITAYVAGAGESALDAHGLTGFLFIHAAELLVFVTVVVMVIAAIIAHRGMRDLGLRGGQRHDELAGADRPPPPQ